MVCSRCRIDHYCSRKCQVADHSEHVEHCDEYVRFHEQEDPNAPKRNESSYIIYANATRADAKAQNPYATYGDLAKILWLSFKELPADERAYWDRKAAEDKERYIKEMATYENVDELTMANIMAEPPKRNTSSFLIYANANRANMKAEYPDANFGDLAKIASTKFKGLSADERAYWDEKAAEDEVRYITEMAAYEAAKGR